MPPSVGGRSRGTGWSTSKAGLPSLPPRPVPAQRGEERPSLTRRRDTVALPTRQVPGEQASVIEHLVLLREGAAVHGGWGALQAGPALGPGAPGQLPPVLLFGAGGLGGSRHDGGLLR